eukprot:jgi/Chlat1/1498/Chrsp12S02041
MADLKAGAIDDDDGVLLEAVRLGSDDDEDYGDKHESQPAATSKPVGTVTEIEEVAETPPKPRTEDYDDDDEIDEAYGARNNLSGWGWGGWAQSALQSVNAVTREVTKASQEISQQALKTVKGAADAVSHTVVDTLVDLAGDEDTDPETETTSTEQSPLKAAAAETATVEAQNLDEVERSAKSVLDRLDKQRPEPSPLDASLRVLDSVENLTAGALTALGSAFSRGMSVVQRVESSTVGLAKNGGLANLATTSKQWTSSLAARGTGALESVGSAAINFLAPPPSSRQATSGPLSAVGGPLNAPGQNENTFDRCFYIFGGHEHLEELEALANSRQLKCVEARDAMTAEQRKAYEEHELQVKEALDLEADREYDDENDAELELDPHPDLSAFTSLSQNGAQMANTLAAESLEPPLAADDVGEIGGAKLSVRASKGIEVVRTEGVQRLSELCSLCVGHLLHLAQGVSLAKRNESQPAPDAAADATGTDASAAESVKWPEACGEKAQVVRAHARQMLQELESLSEGVMEGIGSIVEVFNKAANSVPELDASWTEEQKKALKVASKTASDAFYLDSMAAATCIHDGARHMVPILLATAL